jgi:hypothetical protein
MSRQGLLCLLIFYGPNLNPPTRTFGLKGAILVGTSIDGGQAVVYPTHLTLGGLEFIPGFDTGQGCSLGFGVGADVLPLP